MCKKFNAAVFYSNNGQLNLERFKEKYENQEILQVKLAICKWINVK